MTLAFAPPWAFSHVASREHPTRRSAGSPEPATATRTAPRHPSLCGGAPSLRRLAELLDALVRTTTASTYVADDQGWLRKSVTPIPMHACITAALASSLCIAKFGKVYYSDHRHLLLTSAKQGSVIWIYIHFTDSTSWAHDGYMSVEVNRSEGIGHVYESAKSADLLTETDAMKSLMDARKVQARRTAASTG